MREEKGQRNGNVKVEERTCEGKKELRTEEKSQGKKRERRGKVEQRLKVILK